MKVGKDIVLLLVAAMVGVFGTSFMAALAADRQTASKSGELRGYPVAASTTIYKGSLVALSDAGYAVAASDAANLRVVGVAFEKVDNSAGAAADKTVRVQAGRSFEFAATSITQAMLGDVMFVVDDQTFDDAAGATNEVPCGRLVEFVSTIKGWIYIPSGGCRKAGLSDATYGANEQAMLDDTIS